MNWVQAETQKLETRKAIKFTCTARKNGKWPSFKHINNYCFSLEFCRTAQINCPMWHCDSSWDFRKCFAILGILFVNISHGLKTKKIWLRETIWLLQMSLYEFFRMEYCNKICIWPKTGLLQPRPTDEIQKRRLNKVENAILKP